MAFVILWWISVLTGIVGAVLPGLGMAAAVGLGWLLWRYLPELGDALEAGFDVADDGYGQARSEHPARGAHQGNTRTEQEPA